MQRRYLGVFFCSLFFAGCASQQWVKDYVGQEVVSIKADLREKQQPVEQILEESKKETDALRKELSDIDTKVGLLQARLEDSTKGIEELSKGYQADISGVREDLKSEVNTLKEKIADMDGRLVKIGKGVIALDKSVETLDKRLQALGKPSGP